MDCLEHMKSLPDKYYDLTLADPPYGIDINSSGRICKEKGRAYKEWDRTPPAKEYFDDLRDMWLSTLTNMEDDAKSWSLEITRIMVEDLINSLVLNEDFNEWLTDWKNRYKEVMSIDRDNTIFWFSFTHFFSPLLIRTQLVE